DEAGQGDRRPDGQQGARAKRGGEGVVPPLADRHLVGPARRPALRHRPPEGAHEGAALQRGQADGYLGTLQDEQGPAPARRRPPQVTLDSDREDAGTLSAWI